MSEDQVTPSLEVTVIQDASSEPDTPVGMREMLERLRARLIDTTLRNTMLNFKAKGSKVIPFTDEVPDALYAQLVEKGKTLSLEVTQPDPSYQGPKRDQVEEVIPDPNEAGYVNRRAYHDNEVQTALLPSAFDKRLRKLFTDYRSMLESTGANLLFVAFGFLRWSAPNRNKEDLLAPLILVPVEMKRSFVTEERELTDAEGNLRMQSVRVYRYTIEYTGEEVQMNHSLRHALRSPSFGVELPEFDGDEEGAIEKPEAYFAEMRNLLSAWKTPGEKPWAVERNMRLSLFTFGDEVVFRDLDPENWPEGSLLNADLVKAILGEGTFQEIEECTLADVERHFHEDPVPTVLDADSSQLQALLQVRKGTSMVIQGPPGTGKSQTITNLIAAAMADGKSVLFMSEKLAALEVVRNRLQRVGLGPYLLELHSKTASPRQVLEKVSGRVQHQAASAKSNSSLLQRNKDAEALQAYCNLLATNVPELRASMFEVFGNLSLSEDCLEQSLKAEGATNSLRELQKGLRFPESGKVSIDDWTQVQRALDTIGAYRRENDLVKAKVWEGFSADDMPPASRDAIAAILDRALVPLTQATQLIAATGEVEGLTELDTMQWRELEASFGQLDQAPAILIQAMATRVATDNAATSSYAAFLTAMRALRADQSSVAYRLALDEALSDSIQDNASQSARKAAALPELSEATLAQANDRVATIDQLLARMEKAIGCNAKLSHLLNAEMPAPNLKALRVSHSWIKQLLHASNDVVTQVQPSYATSIAQHAYEKTHLEATKLLGEAERLGKYYVMRDAPQAAVLADFRREFRVARSSFWRHFGFTRDGKTWRRAKSFAVQPDAMGEEAYLTNLDALESWYQESDAYAKKAQARELIGKRFQGHTSDWQGIGATFKLAADIRNWLGSEALAESCIARTQALRESPSEATQALESLELQLADFERLIPRGIMGDSEKIDQLGLEALKDRLSGYRSRLKTLILDMESLPLEPTMTFGTIQSCIRQARELRNHLKVVNEAVADPDYLGEAWTGVDLTNLDHVDQSLRWTQKVLKHLEAFPTLCASLLMAQSPERFSRVHELIAKVMPEVAAWSAAIIDVGSQGSVKEGSAFSVHQREESIAQLLEHLRLCRERVDLLPYWCQYQRHRATLRTHGCDEVLSLADRRNLGNTPTKHLFDYWFWLGWAGRLREAHVELKTFDRVHHEQLRKAFAKGDRALPESCRGSIDAQLAPKTKDLPRGQSTRPVSSFTEMSLLNHEMQKKTRYASVRRLVNQAGSSLRTLFPCWMMSPSSVAQFLPAELSSFDLVVMDEASQLRPESAIGAFARSKQAIVVGDSKQMPPTDFFRSVKDDDIDEDQKGAAEDLESVLDTMAGVLPSVSLNWHYRSQHESLITFSNEHYYNNRLIVPPSVHRHHDRLGVHFHHIATSSYKDSRNPVEAGEVITFVANFIIEESTKPADQQLSIGIVSMNVQQRDLLIELFEKDIQENEALSLALQTYRPEEEYFFKNLENVQGDERDVMVVSVTYGPDRDSGKVFRRFGPIGQNGGERRLNVLFTRARQAMHVFSTMRASDIPPATTESVLAGPEHLRGYLKYAEEGILSDPGQVTDRAPDSPFEEAVLSVLQGMGYQAHAQVGVQGFFIDIGVLVPGATSQYLCGIECDGASYHSDPVSRDRDRLREDILRARGWKIYRIWSTDWWQRRESEIVRLKKYLEGLCGVA